MQLNIESLSIDTLQKIIRNLLKSASDDKREKFLQKWEAKKNIYKWITNNEFHNIQSKETLLKMVRQLKRK